MSSSEDALLAVSQMQREALDRLTKRGQALHEIREAGEAEGISPKLIAEGEASMRSAFAMADAMDSIFGSMFGGKK